MTGDIVLCIAVRWEVKRRTTGGVWLVGRSGLSGRIEVSAMWCPGRGHDS
jgi:hypothetical protein